ncbi:MAG: hypothetical protein KC609_19675 [Myxococcales bacterium]|nr:hypothetical protein [Myxococcales bacterium]
MSEAPTAPRRIDLNWLIIASLLAIVVVANWMLLRPKKLDKPRFRFAAFHVDIDGYRRQRALDRKKLSTFRLGDPEKKLLAAYHTYSEKEFHFEYQRKRKERAALRGKLVEQVRRYVSERGPGNFVRLALYAAAESSKRLDRFLGAVEQSKQSVYQFLRHNAGDDRTRALLSWCGSFIFLGVRSGLVPHNAKIDASGRVVAYVLFKYQFLLLAAEVTIPHQYLTAYELDAFLRWKVEANRIAKLDSRLKALADLRRISPSYPTDKAMGIVLARAHRYNRAARQFWIAFWKNPADLEVAHYLDWLTRPENR